MWMSNYDYENESIHVDNDNDDDQDDDGIKQWTRISKKISLFNCTFSMECHGFHWITLRSV